MNRSLQESKHLHACAHMHTHNEATCVDIWAIKNVLSQVARLAAPLSTKEEVSGVCSL